MHDIDWSCPTDLHPYELAYELEDQKRENDIWRWCRDYFISAMTYSIEHCLNGKKAKTEYIKHAADRYRKEEDYDTKIRKALLAEQMWIANAQQRHLPKPFEKE